MLCKKCGKPIKIEARFCPNCGSPNELGNTHHENIVTYDRQFKNTQREVVSSTRKMWGIVIRVVILAALVVGMFVLAHLSDLNYADPDIDAIREKESLKNSEEYSEIMDQYIRDGEYQELASFVSYHNINFLPEGYEKFDAIDRCAQAYRDCVSDLEQIVLNREAEDFFDGTETDITTFSISIRNFYDTYSVQIEREEDPFYLDRMKDMEENVRAMLKVYLGLGDEEVEEFITLSKDKMAVRVEEAITGSQAEE